MGRRALCSSYMPTVTSKMEKTIMMSTLESVSEMLGSGIAAAPKTTTSPELAVCMTYFKCAKILLDKTIEASVVKPPLSNLDTMDRDKHLVMVEEPEEVGYVVDVDNGILKSVKFPDGKELDRDTMIEINGVAMEYYKAKGKQCKTGRVL